MFQHKIRPFKPGRCKSHDIEKIISAPLVAAAHANSMMQREQTTFMMETGFNEVNGRFEPIMIEMVLIQHVMDDTSNENGSPNMKAIETTFNLPILTIIPLSSLAVDQVNVQFELEINDQISKNIPNSFNPAMGRPNGSTQLKGKISYDSKEDPSATSTYRRQNSAALKVLINAAPLPLPVGVNTLIDLYQKSIRPIHLNNVPKSNPIKST